MDVTRFFFVFCDIRYLALGLISCDILQYTHEMTILKVLLLKFHKLM